MDALRKVGVDRLEPLRMGGHVAGQKAQKLPEHRIVPLRGLGAREHGLAVGADDGVDFFVALAEPGVSPIYAASR